MKFEIDCSTQVLKINGATLSFASLEELTKPESRGAVYRVERLAESVRLKKIGLMDHVLGRTG